MNEPVYILGGARTDFKRNLKKEGKTIRHLIIEAGKKALDDAKIDAGEIQAGAGGHFQAGQLKKQMQLDRKSGAEGKRGESRGRRIIKKNNKNNCARWRW